MARWFSIAIVAFAGAALARAPDDLVALRSQAVNDPAAAIASGRTLLDAHKLDGRPSDERDVLYWLGNAAIRMSDDAATAEMALRLDSLATASKDELASAYAGLLRAQHWYEHGEPEKGWSETMRAASRIQDNPDPRIRAITALELCDDFNMVGNPRAGLPYCERSTSAWRTIGDGFEISVALNYEGLSRKNVGQFEQAAALFREAREILQRRGDAGYASTIGANLARCYIELGRANEALELLREGWDNERRTGRLYAAFASKIHIVRALIKLARWPEAQAEVDATIADCRAHGWTNKLPELLDMQAQIARARGDLQQALAVQDELMQLQSRGREQAHASTMEELEARYAARERELRIGELEQDNRRHELELQSQRAAAAEAEARSMATALVTMVLAVMSVLLYRLWRKQRRRAEALHVEASHDALTGVENRRAFLRRLDGTLASPGLPPQLDVLMIIDLDHFKKINDRGGHLFGDRVLITVASCLERTLAGRAHLARLGGEEFGVLAPAFGAAEGLRLAERLRAAVSEETLRLGDDEVRVTISVGFAVHDSAVCRFDQNSWIDAADKALYLAKTHGRNRVVSAAA